MRISDWSSDVCSSDLAWRCTSACPSNLPAPWTRSRRKRCLTTFGQRRCNSASKTVVKTDRYRQTQADPARDWAFLCWHLKSANSECRSDALFLSEAQYPSANQTESACSDRGRSDEQPSELQSLMRISYAVFCLKKKKTK